MSERSAEALIAIRQIQRKIEQSSKRLAEIEGLTPSQLKVLQMLTEYHEVSVGWICEQTQLKNAPIANRVDRLVARSMVSRRRSESDRRRVWIKLEDAGRAALEHAPDLLQAEFEGRFDELPAWQQSMVVASLELVSSMMDADKIEAAPLLQTGWLGEKSK